MRSRRARPVLSTLVVLCVNAGSHVAVADGDAFECRVYQPTSVVRLIAKEQDGGCAGFEVRSASGGTLQSFKGWLGSGLLLSSADGSRVAFVHAYPLAHVGHDGLLHDVSAPEQRIVGVKIFADGLPLSSFDLNALIVRPDMVDSTAESHVRWLRKLALEGPSRTQLKLETTSLRRLVFELRSGKLIQTENTEEWNRCPIIVRGRPVPGENGSQLVDAVFAKGSASLPLKLVGAEKMKGDHVLCLRPARTGYVIVHGLDDLAWNELGAGKK